MYSGLFRHRHQNPALINSINDGHFAGLCTGLRAGRVSVLVIISRPAKSYAKFALLQKYIFVMKRGE